ncbi:hypothetical protein ACQEVI_18895 [Promicromonospora sp. CA-289599]|uniref:hypothetical protein n=1 Tax=Promicromonospora sp. CA-289599 TaxID=3240014 RepID=UPI003D8D5682
MRDAGIAVSGAWQGLGACYETPDTDQVLRALDPVRVATGKLADDLDAVAGVLDRFADEVRSLQAKRSSLVAQIGDFRSRAATEAAPFGSPTLPGVLAPELSFENQTLLGQSRLLGERFETAELECASKIKAIGSPATLLDRAGTWLQDTTAAIGASISGAVQETKEAWDTTADAVQDAVATGWEWTTETVDDVASWVGDRDDAVGGSWVDLREAFGLFPVAFAGTADNSRPQLTRVGAAYLQTLGALMDAGVTTTTAGIWDVDLAGDGEPAVGTPIKHDGSLDGQRRPRELNGIRDVLWSVTDSYDTNTDLGKVAHNDWAEGYVRVTKISPARGGEPRMVVSIPGTQPWFPLDDLGNDHPADFIGDLVGAAGGRSTYSDTVAMAIDEVIAADPDLAADTPILLAGHSLGGITAGDLASDPDFLADHNVTDVITAGSPIDNNRIAEEIHVLEIAHEGDVVPGLDFSDTRVTVEPGLGMIPLMPVHVELSSSGHAPDPDRHTKVILPNPPGSDDPKGYHDHFAYHESVEHALPSSRLAQPTPSGVALPRQAGLESYERRLTGEGNYLDLNAQYEVYDIPVRRK